MVKRGREVATVRIAYKEPRVMAEIGCNHMGDFEIAKELLTLAKQSGADFGKFQKRNPKELLTAEQFEAPHPNPRNAYGDTYGAHREYLELTVDQHRELKKVRRRQCAHVFAAWGNPHGGWKCDLCTEPHQRCAQQQLKRCLSYAHHTPTLFAARCLSTATRLGWAILVPCGTQPRRARLCRSTRR